MIWAILALIGSGLSVRSANPEERKKLHRIGDDPVLFTLGLSTLRNGHPWMFFFGIFFPLLWIFGAFMRPESKSEYA